ncbi:MAG: glycosyltransferase [Barnesiella sp.]|nr:glycosyltransferase [Barnesiella sp.]MBD5375128.1 glycosyltransferase [Bacteroides sp.]
MENTTVAIDLLFETSWEVCNKIGGIYTVLSTKAKTLQKLYKDKVVFIGPDVWSESNPSPYFIESKTLLKAWKAKAGLPEGVSVRVGRWDVPGKPIVVLVKFEAMYALNDELYGEMWRRYGVDSLHAYGDYPEACAFSHAAGMVIESLCKYYKVAPKSGKNVIAHFDEWTTGMGLLYVKWKLPHVATIFTTHATSIGRSICGNGKPLYGQLKNYNGDQMARELNMEAKHSLEKAAAHQADCFTTVSEVTALECEQLLELRPAVVTPNGFEQNFVPAKTRFKAAREAARKKLMDVAEALTGRRVADHAMLIATSGRCEYRNKGIDVFLDAVNALSYRNPGREVVAFVMVPAWSREAREDLRKAIEAKDGARLTDPVITHWLNNPESDPIINRIHGIGFGNDADSRVNVIYVPCYLNGADGIFNSPYYDLLIGMDATVFPSYYEPWGYTPLESVAFGVPTVTTSLSGFGQWVLDTTDNQFDSCGVTVIGRGDDNYHETVDSIARALHFLNDCGEEEQQHISAAAMQTAGRAAWSYFMAYYVEAFEVALAHNRTNK